MKKLALGKGGGKPLGKAKGKLAFGRMNKGKPALPKKSAVSDRPTELPSRLCTNN